MRHYDVVCAVIGNEDEEVLCMRRPLRGSVSTAGKWEFPGGKIEPGESAHDALIREIHEELDYDVTIVGVLPTIEHVYSDFSIALTPFLCRADSRDFTRREHIDHCWLPISDLHTLDWADADREILKYLYIDLNDLYSSF